MQENQVLRMRNKTSFIFKYTITKQLKLWKTLLKVIHKLILEQFNEFIS